MIFSYIQNLASSKLTWPVCFSIVMIFSQVDTFPKLACIQVFLKSVLIIFSQKTARKKIQPCGILHSNGISPCSVGNTFSKGPFSIDMLVYRSVSKETNDQMGDWPSSKKHDDFCSRPLCGRATSTRCSVFLVHINQECWRLHNSKYE